VTRSAAARRIDEPNVERFDPINRLLDAWEVHTQDLIERGTEPQLRARLERLLPAPEMTISTDMKIELTNLLALLRDQKSRRHTEAEHQRWAHARGLVVRLMEMASA